MIHLVQIVLLVLIALPSHAQRGGHTPPKEAFMACSGKSGGASCSMQTPHGNLKGSCRTPPGQSSLVCVPERGARGASRPNGKMTDRQGSQSGSNRPPMRKHTITQSNGLKKLVPATDTPSSSQYYSSKIEGKWRIIKSNAIPDHKVGKFPNSGNPHSISQQNFEIRIPAQPQLSSSITNVKIPGWALNGVPFDPGAGEFYQGNRNSGWQYEALSGAVSLGIDENHAHVQPGGKYHYHGLPSLFLKKIGINSKTHSPQIGWATDGFPIYAIYGYKNTKSPNEGITKLRSGYKVRSGRRPTGNGQPGGSYDGTFNADYEYIKGLSNLDECNGRWTITPEYPQGTYAYFLTENYPVVPRCVRGITY